jgi:hypothetical protein
VRGPMDLQDGVACLGAMTQQYCSNKESYINLFINI